MKYARFGKQEVRMYKDKIIAVNSLNLFCSGAVWNLCAKRSNKKFHAKFLAAYTAETVPKFQRQIFAMRTSLNAPRSLVNGPRANTSSIEAHSGTNFHSFSGKFISRPPTSTPINWGAKRFAAGQRNGYRPKGRKILALSAGVFAFSNSDQRSDRNFLASWPQNERSRWRASMLTFRLIGLDFDSNESRRVLGEGKWPTAR